MKKIWRALLLALALLTALLLAVPLFISTDTIRQAAEASASDASGMQVSIGNMSLRLLPVPGLTVSDVSMTDVQGGAPRALIASGQLVVGLVALFDGRLELNGIRFKQVDLRVSEQATGPGVHVIRIDQVSGAVRLSEKRMKLKNWKAELYGGVLRLDANISGLQQTPAMTANLRGADIRMQPLLRDAVGKSHLSGIFSTKLAISTTGLGEAAMRQNLKVDGPVHLSQGSVEGVGLEGTAAALIHGNLAGGAIQYDALKFQLMVRGKQRWLNDIVLDSSHLDATGQVKIDSAGGLSGKIHTSGLAGMSGATFMVAGTTETPRIFPAPSSLIGGTIGGAVGGPVGAAVGAKVGGRTAEVVEGVGGAIKGMFGK